MGAALALLVVAAAFPWVWAAVTAARSDGMHRCPRCGSRNLSAGGCNACRASFRWSFGFHRRAS